jgi:hypothetical protein
VVVVVVVVVLMLVLLLMLVVVVVVVVEVVVVVLAQAARPLTRAVRHQCLHVLHRKACKACKVRPSSVHTLCSLSRHGWAMTVTVMTAMTSA